MTRLLRAIEWFLGLKYRHGNYRQQLADWHLKAAEDGWTRRTNS